jgi:pimeloyl-ACP methyl ester carboxylesterase
MARFLLLHAFPFTGSMWDGVAARLRAEGQDVTAPDLRGFGSAPLGKRAPALSVLVDDMLAVLGEQPAVVVGCSMGGYVALGIAARRPDLVSALGLVDTKATADPEPARRTRADVVTTVEKALSDASPETVAWAQRAMSARSDTRDSLALLTAPIAVVMGEEDSMSPRDEQNLILEVVPHATWVPVSGAGHLSPLEAPDTVASALVNLVVVDERIEID